MTNSILGHRVLRREDPALLTTGGTYVDDLAERGEDGLAGALFVTFLRSSVAHARFTVDATDAREAPGVVAILTVDDLDLPDVAVARPMQAAMARPLLARDVVRFVGEPIAAILTEERAQGPDAAEQIVVDYEWLEPVVDPEAALADDAPLLFPEAGTNLAMRLDHRGEPADFSGCEVVVRQRIVNQRLAPSPIEPRSAAAHWTADGRLVQHIACQGAHPLRDELAEHYGLDPADVRVVCPDVGGGFGAKANLYAEGLVLGALARHAGRPVRWMDSRTDNMTAMGHGRAQVQHVTIGGTRDGRITAYKLEVVQDAGAYPAMGGILPWMTRTMLTGVYDIPNAQFSSRSVVTTTTPTVAYRGAGRPEATAAIERAVDLFAAEIGLDPAEVRRRNLVTPDAFPFTTATGTVYDCGDYEGALDRALAGAGYAELRAEQARRRAAGGPRQLGIGLATYVEITALSGGSEYGSIEVRPDGSAVVTTGSNPYGQGHHTAWAMLAADRLGIPMDRIVVVHGDTDVVPSGAITGGSRSVQLAGAAVHDAAAHAIDLGRERAADLLEAAVDDIVLLTPGPADTAGLLDGAVPGPVAEARFHVAGTPAVSVGWSEVAAAHPDTPLVGLSTFSAAGPTFPFGAHVAVVEVDTETGRVELVRLVAVDDAGTILNPLLAEGQVHGGLAQGAAQALLEEVRFDDDGNPLTANFADYGVISATELPAFERIAMETPTPMNELGAKGIGESGTIGATPAVHNAVIDALAGLGVRHLDMPATAEKVWQAIRSAR